MRKMSSGFNIKNFYNDASIPKEVKETINEIKGVTQEFEEQEYVIEYPLKKHLDTLINDLRVNDDGLIIIVGSEGAGKSYFASQIAHYCSLNLKVPFTIDEVHFDGQEYMNKSFDSGKFTINFLDESRRALNKMRGNSKQNVDFMNYLSECRSQNQLHIILLPAFADLERYVAVHRVKLLLSVEKFRDKSGNLVRGFYNIWQSSKKTLLNMCWENKYKEFPSSMRVHRGRFNNVLCINKKDYDEKKEQAKRDRYYSGSNKNAPDTGNVKPVEQPTNTLSLIQQKMLRLYKEQLGSKAIKEKLCLTTNQWKYNKAQLRKKGFIKAEKIPTQLKQHNYKYKKV